MISLACANSAFVELHFNHVSFESEECLIYNGDLNNGLSNIGTIQKLVTLPSAIRMVIQMPGTGHLNCL